jgi:hypothetical protein
MPASVNTSVNVLTKAVVGSAALPRITEAGNQAACLRGYFENAAQKILCSSARTYDLFE